MMFLLLALGGVPVTTWALLRGLMRHTVVVHEELPPTKRLPELPAPAAPQPRQVQVKRHDPFTADGPAWADLIERADREELERQGPREARIVRSGGCEGPGCSEVLDGNPWVIEVESGTGTEYRSFCSRECLDEWHHHDLEKRAVT